MKRGVLLYLLSILVAGAAIVAILKFGAALPAPVNLSMADSVRAVAAVSEVSAPSVSSTLAEQMNTRFAEPLGRLFLQMLVILVTARIVGHLFTRMGQPGVVGEMVAGVLLGPSLLGMFSPTVFGFIFPADSLGSLGLFSQIGMCLFLFIVGMELNPGQIRARVPAAVAVSHVSIVLPYLLGVALAYLLYRDFAAPGSTFTAFALFMGISMSITAFPVLVRILQERGLSHTPLGNLAMTCAAIGDVTAWILLAFVVAIARATHLTGVMWSLALVLLFVALMISAVRLALPKLIGPQRLMEREPSRHTLTLVVCLIIASALTTQALGIHALFGAFLAGVVMPNQPQFREQIRLRFESLGSILLLPLFFAFTGLHTEIRLLNDPQSWLVCALVIAVATLGKLGGSAAAARVTGMGWNESLQIGALMNTRGLMELIALNIGYDLGILSPRIFTMLVIMALVTTLSTGPILGLLRRSMPRPASR